MNEEENGFDITLNRGTSIERIDRDKKTILDSNGQTHHYDILIMATGSRAAMLKDVPHMKGIFTMRSRVDADKFKAHVDPANGKVVIVGGGLLGIELAASLHEIGVECLHYTAYFQTDGQAAGFGWAASYCRKS